MLVLYIFQTWQVSIQLVLYIYIFPISTENWRIWPIFTNKTPATGFSTRHKQVKGINTHINIYLVVVTPYFLKNHTLWVSHLMSKLIVTDWLFGYSKTPIFTTFSKHPYFKIPNFKTHFQEHTIFTPYPPLINFFSTNSLCFCLITTHDLIYFSPWFTHFVSLKLLPSVMLNSHSCTTPGHLLHPIIPKSTTLRLIFPFCFSLRFLYLNQT